MLRNYLKSALRNLLRRKGYSSINVAGLTIGLACCMLIFQYVVFQTSFDAFNDNAENIYRIGIAEARSGEQPTTSALVGHAAGPHFAEETPEIRRYARIHPEYGSAVVTYDAAGLQRTFKEDRALYVDSTFLSMFTYPLVSGRVERALRQPNTLLLTKTVAEKYFGTVSPIGKQLQYTGWISGTFTVAGVLEDVPATSHLQFDFLLPLNDLLESEQYKSEGSAWGWSNFMAYVELDPRARPEEVASKLTAAYYRAQGENIEARNAVASVELQPLRSVHLDPDTFGGAVQGTDPKTVYFFSIIAIVTLVIALINYVNLATARAMDRAREVGVRKVVGAHRRQLMSQFLLESVFANLAALVLALAVATLLTPAVNRLAGTELGLSTWANGRFFAIFGGVFVLSVMLSGLYPAFVLSAFRPASVLKGRRASFSGRVGLRKALVVVQFTASIVLLIGTGVVISQVNYMRTRDVGLSLDQILVVSAPSVVEDGIDQGSALNAFAGEIARLSAVSSYAVSGTVPGRGFNWYSQLRRAAADPSTEKDARATSIDHRFLELYGVDLLLGQPFRENMPRAGDGQPRRVLINETAVQALGYDQNQEALDQLITMGGGEFVVHGVVEDLNWSSLHQPAEAVMFQHGFSGDYISFRVAASNLAATMDVVRDRYEAMFPGNPFEYTFADAAFAEQYRNDQRFARLFGLFAALAILIACLGLFGLAAFTAETRTKEIGVRKVLGASVAGIVALLSRDFLLLVGVAILVAVPLAWYLMQQWLADFAYHIRLGPGIFLAAGAATIAIAMLTVSYKSVKAAMIDPVRSLRYE